MTREISRLRLDYPQWRIWTSDAGRLYATRPGFSVLVPGASVTVDAGTPDGLRQAIVTAEREHATMVRQQI